ncbi:nitroreductase family deazaflavin-dependent oxidoreductase [Galbitalea sp. SE-J8]|uniref:nitroreductase family deazaflavin-dependent oxidoreductase n=1 Tax=Galbitalea sp. SE-J8 TaxID=3054952 RepID=UPI00259C8AB3|nr:nitroreductase family deazaflavin-dependent oxidoreductase [Galbitalea sp. SE-J8]MDM4761972.1 nitroreductase family deazaflavin-dependent oxidoreductase [Galbitalea sp. SE-J8]
MTRGGILRRGWLALIKRTLNHATLASARRGRGRFSIVRHVGRRSGREFETPIIVAPVADGFVAELTYGPGVNWYRNIVAAGRCEVVFHGEDIAIDRIERMPTDAGRAAFPPLERRVLALLRRDQFIHLHRS